jgi:anti-anti-sigma factor
MTVDTEERDGDRCVRIRGELTVYRAAALRPALRDLARRRGALTLDLTHVTEMDTAGLQLLLAFRREANERDGTVRIEAAAPAVRELLQLTNVAQCFGLPHRTATPANAG